MINSVGLQGPGVEAWLEHDLPPLVAAGARVVVSIWGRSVAEYEAAAALLADAPASVVAVEVNLSCPEHRGRTRPVRARRAADRRRDGGHRRVRSSSVGQAQPERHRPRPDRRRRPAGRRRGRHARQHGPRHGHRPGDGRLPARIGSTRRRRVRPGHPPRRGPRRARRPRGAARPPDRRGGRHRPRRRRRRAAPRRRARGPGRHRHLRRSPGSEPRPRGARAVGRAHRTPDDRQQRGRRPRKEPVDDHRHRGPAEVRAKLAVALDVDDAVAALRLARELRPWFGVAKVGLELYSAAGPDVVGALADLGYDVFATSSSTTSPPPSGGPRG